MRQIVEGLRGMPCLSPGGSTPEKAAAQAHQSICRHLATAAPKLLLQTPAENRLKALESAHVAKGIGAFGVLMIEVCK